MTPAEPRRVESFLRDVAQACVTHGAFTSGHAWLYMGEADDGARNYRQVLYEVDHDTGKAIATTPGEAVPFASVEVDTTPPPF